MTNQNNVAEIVYFDGGRIYKALSAIEMHRQYNKGSDPTGVSVSHKNDGKQYFVAHEYAKFFGETSSTCISMERHNACPHVTLWLGIGAESQDDVLNCDIYFAVDSSAQLHQIADWYGLPYPVNAEIGDLIDNAPETICAQNAGGKPIVFGGVKYMDGQPVVLKLYTQPKPFGSWSVWMYGASYMEEGKCFESGAIYQMLTGGKDLPGAHMRGRDSFRKAERIYSDRADGVRTNYAFVDKDPCMFWQGNEVDSSGNLVRVKRYETARWVQRAISKLNKGTDFEGFDLCPAVQYWLGRSWYDDGGEQELLFAVTGGSAQLDAVARYYSLPIPYSNAQKSVLNTQPELYRARHYDLLGLGLGQYVNVVVGSVAFTDGVPTRLLFYTFLRQWECEEQIVMPSFV